MSDYRVNVRLRNNRILSRVEQAGYPSMVAFCTAFGIDYNRLNSVINLRMPALTKRGSYIKLVQALADALSCNPDDLFTDVQARAAVTPRAERVVDEETALSLAAPEAQTLAVPSHEDEIATRRQAEKLLAIDSLTTRERDIVRRRFGICCPQETLEQTGAAYGLNRESIRQIESRALLKMKVAATKRFKMRDIRA